MCQFVIVHCVWEAWDSWATCSASCGKGVQVRTRKVQSYEENDGFPCSGPSSEQKNCNIINCPPGKKSNGL